jgi:glutamate synthase domain-containing protein 1
MDMAVELFLQQGDLFLKLMMMLFPEAWEKHGIKG